VAGNNIAIEELAERLQVGGKQSGRVEPHTRSG
jgi:hypothetical protein